MAAARAAEQARLLAEAERQRQADEARLRDIAVTQIQTRLRGRRASQHMAAVRRASLLIQSVLRNRAASQCCPARLVGETRRVRE